MKKMLCLPTVAVAMLLFMSPTAQAPPRGPQTHIVTVGSPDIIFEGSPPGSDANFSLIAIEDAAGNIHGQWIDHFGGFSGLHMTVTCLEVVGNVAWVGGIVTGASPDLLFLIGTEAVTQCVDVGQTPNDPPDLLSFTFLESDFFPPQTPLQFCDGVTSFFPFLFPINAGQVRVR